MRLNRVLLLAATINILIFALVLISCGSDGSKGGDGASCWAEGDSDDGWEVICGKDGKNRTVGYLRQSDEGTPGAQGSTGPQGALGSYCQLGNNTINGYEILCGGTSQGFLDGCTVTGYPRNDYMATITCGKSKPINLCNGEIFDPAKKACSDEDGTLIAGGVQLKTCGKATYNPSTQYCGYATKADADKKSETVLALCGNDIKKPFEPFPLNKEDLLITDIARQDTCVLFGGKWTSSGCSISDDADVEVDDYTGTDPKNRVGLTKKEKCEKYAPMGYLDDSDNCHYKLSKWKYEYCRYYPYFDGNKQKLWAYSSTEYCGISGNDIASGDNSKRIPANAINAALPDGKGGYTGGWQKQYCGYKDKNTAVKTVLGGLSTADNVRLISLCDDYGYQFTASSGAESTKIPALNSSSEYVNPENVIAYNNSLNLSNAPNASPPYKRELLSVGPNEKAFDYGYCVVGKESFLEGKTETEYTEKICGIRESATINKNGPSTKNKPNNGSWKGEYCGWSISGKSPDFEYTSKVENDLCDDLNGPKEFKDQITDPKIGVGWCRANRNGLTEYAAPDEKCIAGKEGGTSFTYKTINEGKWKGEYCGYSSKDTKAVLTGICDDDRGPSESEPNEGYCQGYKLQDSLWVAKTQWVPINTTCQDGKKYNEGSWKNEYCGIPAADISDNTLFTTGACDDGKGPNSESFGGGYCQAVQPDTLTGVTYTVYTSDFCGDDAKYNENTWKGEYCGKDESGESKVYAGVCDIGGGPNSSGFGSAYCAGVLGSKLTQLTYISDATCQAKPNEGSWKGEYCFNGDQKIGICTGNHRPAADASSTDPYSVRCTFQNDYVCSTSKLGACDKDACDNLGEGYAWDSTNKECIESLAVAAKRAKKLAKK